MTKLVYALPLALFACASEVSEESGTSTAELRCPSPTRDREGFIACVKKKTSATKAGERTKSETGGGGRCSSLSIACKDDRCTCSANGGPEQECNGSDCDEICCP